LSEPEIDVLVLLRGEMDSSVLLLALLDEELEFAWALAPALEPVFDVGDNIDGDLGCGRVSDEALRWAGRTALPPLPLLHAPDATRGSDAIVDDESDVRV